MSCLFAATYPERTRRSSSMGRTPSGEIPMHDYPWAATRRASDERYRASRWSASGASTPTSAPWRRMRTLRFARGGRSARTAARKSRSGTRSDPDEQRDRRARRSCRRSKFRRLSSTASAIATLASRKGVTSQSTSPVLGSWSWRVMTTCRLGFDRRRRSSTRSQEFLDRCSARARAGAGPARRCCSRTSSVRRETCGRARRPALARAARSGTTPSSGASSTAFRVARSKPRAMGSSRPSTGPPRAIRCGSSDTGRDAGPRTRAPSRPAHRVSASSWAPRSVGSPSTPVRASPLLRAQARFSSRAPSVTSWPVQASRSTTAASASSRASGTWRLYAVANA